MDIRQRQKEATKQKLYEAAIEIFARDGVGPANIADITTLADVSRAAFYFHFPTKDDVLMQLMHNREEQVLEALEALPDDVTLAQLFDVFINATVRAWSDPRHAKMLIDVFAVRVRRTSVLDDRESEIIRSAMARRFTAASVRGELSPLIPAPNLSDLYLLNCFAIMASWAVDVSRPLEPSLRSMTELFMNGAAPKSRDTTFKLLNFTQPMQPGA